MAPPQTHPPQIRLTHPLPRLQRRASWRESLSPCANMDVGQRHRVYSAAAALLWLAARSPARQRLAVSRVCPPFFLRLFCVGIQIKFWKLTPPNGSAHRKEYRKRKRGTGHLLARRTRPRHHSSPLPRTHTRQTLPLHSSTMEIFVKTRASPCLPLVLVVPHATGTPSGVGCHRFFIVKRVLPFRNSQGCCP